MSALTDLFTALANKIRSKTGGSDTYTPAEMVSDGIDDVYDAGVASVPVTSITPSNATPASISSGTNYNPTANGYAISSYETKTPSNSSTVSLTSGDIYKMGGNGYAIYSYTPKTPSNASPSSVSAAQFYKISKSGYLIQSYSDITPSDSTPVEITSGNIYKAGGAGYAIASSPTALAPSDSTPATISNGSIYKASSGGYAIASSPTALAPNDSTPATITSGTIYKASGNGYAYASQVTPASKTETTLWTNSAPTSTFSAQAVTLSQSIDNFDYIKIKHASVRNQTTNNVFLMETIYSKEDVRKCTNSSSTVQMALCGKVGSAYAVARYIWYVSDTELNISDVKYIGGSWSLDNSQEIPISIVGIKYTGV